MTAVFFPPEITSTIVTKHAEARCRQRGVRAEDLALLEQHADVCLPAGSGAEQLMLSSLAASALVADGYPCAVVDRLRNLALIRQGCVIVTVHHAERGRRKKLRRATDRLGLSQRRKHREWMRDKPSGGNRA